MLGIPANQWNVIDPNEVSETAHMWMASKEKSMDLIDSDLTMLYNAPVIRFQDETIPFEIETTIQTSKIWQLTYFFCNDTE